MKSILSTLLLLFAGTAAAETVIYPPPAADTLKQLSNLRASGRYRVTVNGQPVFVFEATNRTGPDPRTGEPIPKGRIETVHFCSFSFRDEPVQIMISSPSGTDLTQSTLHPARWQLPLLRQGDGSVSFELKVPRKLVLKTQQDELHPLLILADEPDTDLPEGGDLLRFRPGFHDIGLQYEVHDGQTVYIDGGAIVRGSLRKPQEKGPLKNFTLRGRGMLYSGDYEFIGLRGGWGRGITAWEGGLENGHIEGVMLVDSLHWNMGFRNRDSLFDNVKIISFHGNTDGLRVGRNSTARNSFVMNNDDSLLPEGHNYEDGMSMLIEDCVVWHHSWGNPFKIINLSEAGGTGVQNLTYRNIDVIETGSDDTYCFVSPDTGGHAFRKEQSPTCNVLFENIFIEQGESIFNLFPPGSSTLSNVVFRNVHVPVATGAISGWSEAHCIEDLVFDDLYAGGKKIESLDETEIRVGPYVRGLIVK